MHPLGGAGLLQTLASPSPPSSCSRVLVCPCVLLYVYNCSPSGTILTLTCICCDFLVWFEILASMPPPHGSVRNTQKRYSLDLVPLSVSDNSWKLSLLFRTLRCDVSSDGSELCASGVAEASCVRWLKMKISQNVLFKNIFKK